MFVNAKGGLHSSDPVISIFPTHIYQEDQQLYSMRLLRAQVEANRVRQSKSCQMLLTNLGRPSKNICIRLVKQTEQGIRELVHFEVLKPGETVNTDSYCDQLDRLNQSLIEKYPAIINRKGVILQHDNARLHCARKTMERINGLGWEVLSHLPYSPDIAPMDFHLFRSMQHFLNKKLQNSDGLKNAISRYFTEKPIDFYRFVIENLHPRWKKALANEGDYIID
ncbi:histone-lysine N-methyltransferase SETMAR [Trichonephila clavipes]|nr:histone-lysine N-methyltransferase SETMAR [Trichonephila clavipes]